MTDKKNDINTGSTTPTKHNGIGLHNVISYVISIITLVGVVFVAYATNVAENAIDDHVYKGHPEQKVTENDISYLRSAIESNQTRNEAAIKEVKQAIVDNQKLLINILREMHTSTNGDEKAYYKD